jgi:hypothetical protein
MLTRHTLIPYAANAPYRIDIFDDTATATLASSARAQDADGSARPADQMWLVIQGNDQYDGSFTDRLALLKIGTGIIFNIACTIANTLVPGEYVCANAGALEKVTRVEGNIGGYLLAVSNHKQPVGVVIYSNGVAGATGYIIVAS